MEIIAIRTVSRWFAAQQLHQISVLDAGEPRIFVTVGHLEPSAVINCRQTYERDGRVPSQVDCHALAYALRVWLAGAGQRERVAWFDSWLK